MQTTRIGTTRFGNSQYAQLLLPIISKLVRERKCEDNMPDPKPSVALSRQSQQGPPIQHGVFGVSIGIRQKGLVHKGLEET